MELSNNEEAIQTFGYTGVTDESDTFVFGNGEKLTSLTLLWKQL